MSPLIYITIATFLVSAGAFIGIFTLSLKHDFLHKILFWLIALSAGTLLGGAFLHLLPEASETFPDGSYYPWVLGSFIVFFLIEKILYWRHCHDHDCDTHTFGHMNLLGDALHNFIDGMVIAGAFLTDTSLGIATTIAIAFHEIPQEIGDFGVLLYSGYSKSSALLANVAVALTAVLGGLTGYWLGTTAESIIPYLLPIAAGGFIYIATSDLIPELRKQADPKKAAMSFCLFLCGIGIMWLVNSNHSHSHTHEHDHLLESEHELEHFNESELEFGHEE